MVAITWHNLQSHKRARLLLSKVEKIFSDAIQVKERGKTGDTKWTWRKVFITAPSPIWLARSLLWPVWPQRLRIASGWGRTQREATDPGLLMWKIGLSKMVRQNIFCSSLEQFHVEQFHVLCFNICSTLRVIDVNVESLLQELFSLYRRPCQTTTSLCNRGRDISGISWRSRQPGLVV